MAGKTKIKSLRILKILKMKNPRVLKNTHHFLVLKKIKFPKLSTCPPLKD
jgi:hypothetical protein